MFRVEEDRSISKEVFHLKKETAFSFHFCTHIFRHRQWRSRYIGIERNSHRFHLEQECFVFPIPSCLSLIDDTITLMACVICSWLIVTQWHDVLTLELVMVESVRCKDGGLGGSASESAHGTRLLSDQYVSLEVVFMYKHHIPVTLPLLCVAAEAIHQLDTSCLCLGRKKVVLFAQWFYIRGFVIYTWSGFK